MKNQSQRCEAAAIEPLEVERLTTTDERRPLSVAGHHEWRESLASPARSFDPIDEECGFDDHLQIDPYVTGTNNRRSDTELARILELIDNLPISDNGKEGQH